MREGNSFSLCVSPHLGGVPQPADGGGWGGGGAGCGQGGVPPIQVRWGVPGCGRGHGTPPPSMARSQDGGGGGGYPLLEQHSVYLLRGGRYVSCVHAGGLSCLSYFCMIVLLRLIYEMVIFAD